MRKAILLISVLALGGLAVMGSIPCPAAPQDVPPETDILKAPPQITIYNPAGRRDPFKNLLTGKEIKDKAAAGGPPQISIDDIRLVGIVKSNRNLTAIVTGPQGFPQFVKVGDKFSDGYVLAIKDAQVVFRKTKERGMPLMRAKDIIKEINPEER